MPEQLKEARVDVGDLFLDPNNPRYADIMVMGQPVREDRVHEDSVQRKAKERILSDRFDVTQLKESIQTIGFLPVDRLVVVELPQAGKYMVIEGNRRLAALESLLDDYESGAVDLLDAVKSSIKDIPVLIIEGDDQTKRNHFARVLQGVRHVSSVKAWGPYQQAQIIVMMLDDGKQLSEVKEALGLSSIRVNSLRRSYYGLNQMQQDPDYSVYAKPEMFSHFEEAYKQQRLRSWLEWDDENNRYVNEENRRMFYAWCAPFEEDGTEYPPKVVDAKELRLIGKLMDNQALFKQFCDSPTLRLTNAMQGIIEDTPVDWRGILGNNLKALKQIPAVVLMAGDDKDVQMLEEVKTLCGQLIQQIHLAQNIPASGATATPQAVAEEIVGAGIEGAGMDGLVAVEA